MCINPIKGNIHNFQKKKATYWVAFFLIGLAHLLLELFWFGFNQNFTGHQPRKSEDCRRKVKVYKVHKGDKSEPGWIETTLVVAEADPGSRNNQ